MSGYDHGGIVPPHISDRIPYSSADLLARTGMTKRQMDHWTRRGYLRPANPSPGQGTGLVWSGRELRVAVILVGLLRVGFTVPAAAEYARAVVEGSADDGVRMLVTTALTVADM